MLTVFLALGAWRMSQRHVLTRRPPVIETLGSATAICVDKTGTLTMNSMTVRELVVDGVGPRRLTSGHCPSGSTRSSSSPCSPRPSTRSTRWTGRSRTLGERYLADTEHLHDDWDLVREYPLSEDLLALSHVWRSPDTEPTTSIAAKGAPEAIADLCHLDAERARGARPSRSRPPPPTGCASSPSPAPGSAGPRACRPSSTTSTFEFLGLVGLARPRASRRRRRRRRVRPRRRPRRDDHRRLSGHRARHRPGGRPRARRRDASPVRNSTP